MPTHKQYRILYWALTLLVLLPAAGSGVPELFTSGPQSTIQAYHALGYPPYLMKILGFAKLLGAVVILISRPAQFVEWAYAGFCILFLGATASHLLAGDSAHAPIPFVFLLLLTSSYTIRSRKN